MTRLLLGLLLIVSSLSLFSQKSAFDFISVPTPEQQENLPSDYLTASLDLENIKAQLARSPEEFRGKSGSKITLPLPNGEFAQFTVLTSNLIKGAATKEHPAGYKITGPWGHGRLAFSHQGITALLRGPEGYFLIDRLDATASDAYLITDFEGVLEVMGRDDASLTCGASTDDLVHPDANVKEELLAEEMLFEQLAKSAGNEARPLLEYDLLMVATGEFSQAFGGTVEDVMAEFNVAVNILSTLYENELGIRFNLLATSESTIFLDPAIDPFIDASSAPTILNGARDAIESRSVPFASYDIAHVFTRGCRDGIGGQARFGSVCGPLKTEGVTCIRPGRSVAFMASTTMAHELGHSFIANHTWNRCDFSVDQRVPVAAFEPGSGTTIMSYAGTCGSQNTGAEDPYFHGNSLEVMNFFSRSGNGRGCATVVATDNFTPEVSINHEGGFYIPISTPFRLEGSATDANDDTLTYVWEQFDLGPASPIGQPEGNTPLFRTYLPTETGNVRYFPRLDRIVNNITSISEVLPTYSRDLTFRLIARDNNFEAGGFDWEEIAFRADSAAGPFLVNDPEVASMEVGEYQRITWDVANTDKAPVNCTLVNILLSTDGGQTFDVTLAANVPNTGEAMITVPEEAISSQAMLMIEAVGNVFLNVNDNFFQVRAATAPRFTLETDILYNNVCTPTTLEVALSSASILDFTAPIALSIEEGENLEAAVFSLSDTEINPGENATLSADFTDVRYTGRTEIVIVAAAEGQDTARYPVVLDLVDSDYSDLEVTSPEEGITGIILSTDFDWTDAVNADFYDIQVATSPTFAEGTIFEEASNLPASEYALAEFFEPNTIYFWRVRAGNNSCGGGDWLDPRSFRTINTQCTSYTSTDTPRPLPGSGPAFTRESRILVEDQGVISDVNLPNVDLRYNFVSVLTLTLESPAGTKVVLYDRDCRISTNRLDLGFDDDAPRDIACPPDDERVFVPHDPLAAFIGENTFGDWILEVAVSETGGSAGSLQSWEIEFCADLASVPPVRVTNIATEVPPLMKNAILEDKLETSSTAFGNEDIKYTLTALPGNGRLLLYGTELAVGDEFFQDDINGAGLEYENTSGEEGTDDFGFIITTPDGGFLSIDYHDIIIDANAVVSNRGLSPLEANLTAFPNPVASDLNIRWTAEVNRELDLELFDLNGRLLQRQKVAGAAKAAALNIVNLPAGVYLLRVDGAVRRIVKQ